VFCGGSALDLVGVTKNRASYVPVGRIWPSGDFSLGYRRVEPDSRVDYSSHVARIDRLEMAAPGRPGWSIGPYGFPVVDQSAIDVEGNREGLSVAAECEAQERYCAAPIGERLDLTTPANSHSTAVGPEKYGKRGITGYGRRMVKSAATLMKRMPGKRLTFCTVTMPPLSRGLRRELALAWPEFLRQLIQWLARQLRKSGLPGLVCSVSEIQPKRLKALNEGYLHLHLVWINHYARSGNWAVDVDLLKTWCSEFLQRRGLWEADSWVNVDVQQVKKTAAGYLAKYMSKGSAEIEQFAEDCGWDAVPGQWWNLSKPARDLVKRFTYEGDEVGALLESVVNYTLASQELHVYHVFQPAILDYDGKERIVGWFGVLTQEFRSDLVAILKSN
jgi:hypothetical protein